MPVKVELTRLEDTIKKYEEYPIEKNKILLYGSSFFTNWGYEAVKQDLSGICGEEDAVVNHGFGGSTGDEQLYYYHRMVKPFEPKMIVLRGCVNDIIRGYSPDEAIEASMRLYAFAKTDFPDLKFAILTAFDYKSARENVIAGMKTYNEKIREYASQPELYPDLYVIDMIPLLYEDPANAGTYQGFKDIFREDGLHFPANVYTELWGPFLKAEIEKILSK